MKEALDAPASIIEDCQKLLVGHLDLVGSDATTAISLLLSILGGPKSQECAYCRRGDQLRYQRLRHQRRWS